ncbi:MAG: hypothetical protein O7B35_05075, partial [Deltaproteobacteria bacterium]|nr:hypothetical protein [Deltaproteobacteria bacterium]
FGLRVLCGEKGTLLTSWNNSDGAGSIFFIMQEHTESVRHAVLILESARLSFAHGQKPGVGKTSRSTGEGWRTTKGEGEYP